MAHLIQDCKLLDHILLLDEVATVPLQPISCAKLPFEHHCVSLRVRAKQFLQHGVESRGSAFEERIKEAPEDGLHHLLVIANQVTNKLVNKYPSRRCDASQVPLSNSLPGTNLLSNQDHNVQLVSC